MFLINSIMYVCLGHSKIKLILQLVSRKLSRQLNDVVHGHVTERFRESRRSRFPEGTKKKKSRGPEREKGEGGRTVRGRTIEKKLSRKEDTTK